MPEAYDNSIKTPFFNLMVIPPGPFVLKKFRICRGKNPKIIRIELKCPINYRITKWNQPICLENPCALF